MEAGENTLKFTLNDGQSCKMGVNEITFNKEFDAVKKITRIEMIIDKDESKIIEIKFYQNNELLFEIGVQD